MNVTIIAVTCAVAWAAQGPDAGTITRIERGSAREAQLRADAQKWRSAVVARDVRTLARFALPEERRLLTRELRALASPAVQALWGRGDSTRPSARAFFSAPGGTPEIAVFSREVLSPTQKPAFGDATEYATTCFFRGTRAWPDTWAELQRVDDWTQVLCLDWVRAGGHWRMSYTDIAFPDEGDGVG